MDRNQIRVGLAGFAGLSIVGASAATGQLLLSMSYENLDSSFDASSSILSTSSIADSSGSVTRFDPSTSRAAFDEGFADFSFDLAIATSPHRMPTARAASPRLTPTATPSAPM